MQLNKSSKVLIPVGIAVAAISIMAGIVISNSLSSTPDMTGCLASDFARTVAAFNYTMPPSTIGDRHLACIFAEPSSVHLIYSKQPVFVKENLDNATRNGDTIHITIEPKTSGLDPVKNYEELNAAVLAKRPDLQPRTLTINNNPAWGKEGGPDAGIVVIEDSDHKEISRSTEAVPAELSMVVNNSTAYLFQGYVPLSELIQAAQTIR
ncbi:MAG: hypothetical protein HRF40_02605 [Nitrososphaera sp.]